MLMCVMSSLRNDTIKKKKKRDSKNQYDLFLLSVLSPHSSPSLFPHCELALSSMRRS